MKKIRFILALLGILMFYCSNDSTGPDNPDEPGWDDEFTQDCHLLLLWEDALVVYSLDNDSLWDFLPDTLAKVDSAIAFLLRDTVDFTQVVGKDKLILKEDFGKYSYADVIEPGNKIFSINYPDDVPWTFSSNTYDFSISIYVSVFDTTYAFREGYIEGYFHYYPGLTDTSLTYGILADVYTSPFDTIIIDPHVVGDVYFEK